MVQDECQQSGMNQQSFPPIEKLKISHRLHDYPFREPFDAKMNKFTLFYLMEEKLKELVKPALSITRLSP